MEEIVSNIDDNASTVKTFTKHKRNMIRIGDTNSLV